MKSILNILTKNYMQILVKKWGWENAAELEKSPKTLLTDLDSCQVVVVSAMRSPEFNTTDHLLNLANMLSWDETKFWQALEELEKIKDFHSQIVWEKLPMGTDLMDMVEEQFTILKRNITEYYYNSGRRIIPNKTNDYSIEVEGDYISLLWFGEYISACIQRYAIENTCKLKAKVVKFGKSVPKISNISLTSNQLFENLAVYIGRKVSNVLEKWNIAIVPWYIAGFRRWIENAVGRGYSDATASLTAVGLTHYGHDVTLEIQKAVEGMLSCDPRLLENPSEAHLISQVDYITAKEITWVRGAQAKLLHAQTLRSQLQLAGIKVRLYDPFTGGKGTLISQEKNPSSIGIEFIGGKDNVVFFTVSSAIMEESWILAKIFATVQKYTAVDIIGTSQTEVSFTIDGAIGDENLEALSKELHTVLWIGNNAGDEYITYSKSKALVYCIGQNISHHLGMIGRVTTELGNHGINIELISQGIWERAIVLGIDGNDYRKAVNLLHSEFIVNKKR